MLAFAGERRRARRQHDDGMAVAWTTAALTRHGGKRLPPLKRLLARDDAEPLTPDEIEDLAAEHARIEGELGG